MLSLRLRISVTYLLLTVAALLALGLYITNLHDDDLRENKAADLEADAILVRNVLTPILEGDAPLLELERLAELLSADGRTRITLVAADGSVLADSRLRTAAAGNLAGRPEVRQALAQGRGSGESTEAGGEPFTYVAVRTEDDDGNAVVVRVGRSSAQIDASNEEIRRSLVVAIAGVAAMAFVLGALLSRSLLRPLNSIGAAAAAMSHGDLTARVMPRPEGEVGELADAFNQMASTIQEEVAATARERSRLAAALNSSVDGVVALDHDADIVFANVAAQRLFHTDATGFIGRPLVWVMPNDALIEAVRASRDQAQSGTLVVERPGRQYLQVVTTPIRNGGDWAVLVVFHDLTDVKRTEQVRRDFVANVSHELRTPLAGIKSVIETLSDGAIEEPEVAREFLDRADGEVDRLVQMVEELLELSRIESGNIPLNVRLTDIDVLLRDVVTRLRPQAERHRLSLTYEPQGELAEVMLDGALIERAVVNLIHNALKFTPDGGAIVVAAAEEQGLLRVEVRDTGVGIDPRDQSRIFERFYKTDQSRASTGSGLGLALVKHTVEAHGGEVAVESMPGRGSTFSFTIPVGSRAAPRTP